MSRDEDDRIAEIMAREAETARGPALPPFTMTGEQRRDLAAHITESIACHQMHVRRKLPFREAQRVKNVIDTLSRSLAIVNRGASDAQS